MCLFEGNPIPTAFAEQTHSASKGVESDLKPDYVISSIGSYSQRSNAHRKQMHTPGNSHTHTHTHITGVSGAVGRCRLLRFDTTGFDNNRTMLTQMFSIAVTFSWPAGLPAPNGVRER